MAVAVAIMVIEREKIAALFQCEVTEITWALRLIMINWVISTSDAVHSRRSGLLHGCDTL